MTCIISQFGCSCGEKCQDHFEITKAKLIALDERHKEEEREDRKKAVNMVIRASMLILVGLAIGMAFVHADEKFAQQAKIEAV